MILYGEALAAAALVAALFRHRDRLGTAPLFVALGAFAALSIVMRQIDFRSDASASPTMLLGACLFALALVEARDGFAATRSLVHALFLVGLVAIPIGLLLGLHPLGRLRAALLGQDSTAAVAVLAEGVLGGWIAGALLTMLAPIVFCLIHAALAKRLNGQPALRLFLSIALTLTLDRSLDAARIATSGILEPIRNSLAEAFPALVVVPLSASILLGFLRSRPGFHLRGDDLNQANVEPMDSPSAVLSHLFSFSAMPKAMRAEPRDTTTGLRNRTAFDANLPREVERALRLEIELGLMIVAIDEFAAIVEHYGPEEAEEIVRRGAWALRTVLRQTELPCRFADDRFAVILQGANAQTARFLAKRIEKQFRDGGDDAPAIQVPATLTIAAASLPHDATVAEELVDLATRRLDDGGRQAGNKLAGPEQGEFS